ncbi:MAG: GvpL/GvpF family gas vesicle protein [Candidatus Rokubacteria bacterium]|nr:GvpL/GvpF family gas vesicle protein [Candidatus Rokubacteria bacterium]
MNGLYLYGIVGFPPPLLQEIRGLGGCPVFLVSHADLAAVVGRSALHPWPVDEAHLTVHETVVEEVMAARPILPVRFNTCLRTKKAVIALLEERAQAFGSALERVEGKVEMGLRVLWKAARDAEVSADQEIEETGPGTEYLCGRLREERHRAKLLRAGERLIQEVQPLFRSLAVESWLQRFPTARLLFTGAYLVERYRVDAFREGMAKARKEFPRLSFLLTGPWPPYHFVNGAHDEAQDTVHA